MAVEAKFTQPLQVVETEEMRNRVRAVSDEEKISQAQVIREILRGKRPPFADVS